MLKEWRMFLIPLMLASGLMGRSAQAAIQTDRPQAPPQVTLSPYTTAKLNAVLKQVSSHPGLSAGQMTDIVSSAFLDTPYKAHVLQGSATTSEKLIIDFSGLDCYTYMEYVEAARKARSRQAFISNLVMTRYVDGIISFKKRKHFFTDWVSRPYTFVTDITASISPDTLHVVKTLNLKGDGDKYLRGLPLFSRTISYIPSGHVDSRVVSQLHTGDLIGFYTPLPGLDVTHVGFFIMTDHGPVLRNASSRKENQKVIDMPFLDYVAQKPGIIVYRAEN